MRNSIGLFLICFLSACSFFSIPKKKELDLGPPTKTFDVNISGENLYKLINLQILSDSSKNLIRQLGEHAYSTSLDEYNPYARGDVRIYYEFEGIRLEYIGENAGSVTKETLLPSIKEFPKSFYLFSITIEPAKYKGVLPKQIEKKDGPSQIENKLGKHSDHFVNNSSTEHLKYVYPNHGLEIRFNCYPGDINPDSSMYIMIITDSTREMERYPTIYPKKNNR